MASYADMDDDDIYPENDSYEPQESRPQIADDEEEGEEVESDSDVCTGFRYWAAILTAIGRHQFHNRCKGRDTR